MTIHATAIYEKGVLKLDSPLELAEMTRVTIEVVESDLIEPQPDQSIDTNFDLLDPLAGVIGIGSGPTDLAENHDHYLYGTPKK